MPLPRFERTLTGMADKDMVDKGGGTRSDGSPSSFRRRVLSPTARKHCFISLATLNRYTVVKSDSSLKSPKLRCCHLAKCFALHTHVDCRCGNLLLTEKSDISSGFQSTFVCVCVFSDYNECMT